MLSETPLFKSPMIIHSVTLHSGELASALHKRNSVPLNKDLGDSSAGAKPEENKDGAKLKEKVCYHN